MRCWRERIDHGVNHSRVEHPARERTSFACNTARGVRAGDPAATNGRRHDDRWHDEARRLGHRLRAEDRRADRGAGCPAADVVQMEVPKQAFGNGGSGADAPLPPDQSQRSTPGSSPAGYFEVTGSTGGASWRFTKNTRNFAGFDALELRVSTCTSAGVS